MDRELQEAVVKARGRLRVAKVMASGMTSFGVVIGYFATVDSMLAGGPQSPPLLVALVSPVLGALVAAYLLWSLYWGIPAVWRKWLGLAHQLPDLGCMVTLNPVTLLILVALFFYVPLVAGYVYGVLGGGILECRKCRRLAALAT